MSRSTAEQAITSLSLPRVRHVTVRSLLVALFLFPSVFHLLPLSSSCSAAGNGERFILTFMLFCQYLRWILMLAHTCCFLLVDVLYSLSSVVGVDLPDCLEIWLAGIFDF